VVWFSHFSDFTSLLLLFKALIDHILFRIHSENNMSDSDLKIEEVEILEISQMPHQEIEDGNILQSLVEESDVYNRTAIVTPLAGRDAIWNEIVKMLHISVRKQTNIGSSSTAAASATMEEPQPIKYNSQSSDDRMTSEIFTLLDKVMTLPLVRSSLDLRSAQVLIPSSPFDTFISS